MNPKTLQAWFKAHIKDQGKPYTLDKDQAKIVLDDHKNTLVTARAGSGKTRTIVAKVAYLIAYKKVSPESIIIFAFNRKAKTEINERLAQITHDDKPILAQATDLATTFHAFAYKILAQESKLVTEEQADWIILKSLERHLDLPRKLYKDKYQQYLGMSKQFIARSEQQFFKNYAHLHKKIESQPADRTKDTLILLEEVLRDYHAVLKANNQINFNQLIAKAAKKLPTATSYEYIFIDEYQDFSLLFLTLVKSLRKTCPQAKLLAVGDDWQAINRFAGGNVEYFKHFDKYFPEDHKKLFIPTNYRSGKKIVKNANFFMSSALSDFNGCKAGNKLKSAIFLGDVSKIRIPLTKNKQNVSITSQQYYHAIKSIIRKNPGKTIRILSRNNNLSFAPLVKFCAKFPEATSCTIHKSKGLEADIVILLEIDAGDFPGPDKSNGLYSIFGDTEEIRLKDEHRLFYVAITRAKEKLYILTKSTAIEKDTKEYNFLNYLNENFLNPLF